MKWSLGKILDNPKYAFTISITIAVIGWFVVAFSIDPEASREISGVPVNINTQASAISRLELNAIDIAQSKVSVIIWGKRYIIGGLESHDFSVTASLAGVTGPGVYDLPLEVKKLSGDEFEVMHVEPSTVRVKFDRLQSKTLPIEVNIEGLTVPGEDYIVEPATVSPNHVTLSGPEIDINKIDKAVVNINLTGTVEKPIVVKQDIALLDNEGNEITSEYISQDTSAAEVVIPVKKIAELPLTIGFLNIYPGFPSDELSYTLTNETIRVAAVPEILDKYSELHLGYINLKEFRINEPITFEVNLPSGFTNLDNIKSVVAEFDDTDFITSTFNVTAFNIVNTPPQFTSAVTTPRLTGVRISGPKDVVQKITAKDIIAEIDLSEREISPGQFSLPVNIYIPNKGLVWATGDYTAVVSIRQK